MLVVTELLPNIADELTANNYLRLHVDSDITQRYSFGINDTPKSTEVASFGYAIVEKIANRVFMTECRYSFNHTSVYKLATVSTAYSNNSVNMEEGYMAEKIDMVKLVSHSNAIGAGSTIKVYGIRERG